MTTNTSLERVGFNSLSEAMKFAEMISKSSMVPKDYVGKAENVLVSVMMGAEVGLKPFQAMQNIAVINGRPAIWGDAVLGLIQAHPECEYIKEEDLSEIEKKGSATCEIKRKNMPPVINTFNLDMAKKAGLMGKQGPWSQYPARMLKLRARAFSARDAFADVLKGVSIAEEAQDIPEEKDITPIKSKVDELIQQKEQVNHQAQMAQISNDKLTLLIEEINGAESIETLKDIKKQIQLVTELEDKNEAVRVYNQKLKELKNAQMASEASQVSDEISQEREQFLKELGDVE